MMTNQYKVLRKETKKIDKIVKNLQNTLFELLSVQAKELTIGFGDQEFIFCNAQDLADQERMDMKKCQLITLILRDAFDQYFDEKEDVQVWHNVFALAMGENPIEHQQQRIELQKAYEVTEGIRQESGVKALPLDEDAYQVIQERNKDVVDTIVNTIDYFDARFDVETEKELKNDKAWPEDKKRKGKR